MNKPKALLANRLYVPANYVTSEMLNAYTFQIPYIDRFNLDEFGRPIEQIAEVETFKYFEATSTDPAMYGFHRGNLPKMYKYFSGFDIIENRAAPSLGFDLEVNPEVLQDDRWTHPSGQKRMIDLWASIGSGGIQAPPAWGKTVFCLGLVCAIGLKTLVLVHDRTLADQWIDRFKKLTNISDLEALEKEPFIGQYSGRKKKFYPITIATYQSLNSTPANQKFCLDNSDFFGLTINDEGHHEAASTFSLVTTIFNPKHRCWVSATPERKDQMHLAIYDMVGVVLGRGKDNRDTGTVKFLYSGVSINDKKPWVSMVTDLTNSEQRNKMIIDVAVDSVLTENRKVLITTDRIKHAKYLAEKIQILLGPHGFNVESLVGGQSGFEAVFQKVARDEVQVLVGTTVMDEGKDCPPLDTLILATPNNNETKTAQRVGRIQRRFTYPDGRGKQPLRVYDVLDDHPACWAGRNTRERVYREIGFEVEALRRRRAAVLFK